MLDPTSGDGFGPPSPSEKADVTIAVELTEGGSGWQHPHITFTFDTTRITMCLADREEAVSIRDLLASSAISLARMIAFTDDQPLPPEGP